MDLKKYIPDRIFSFSTARARLIYPPFLREIVRYASNDGADDTVGQVAAYADSLDPIASAVWDAPAVANSTILAKWAETLNMTTQALLIFIRSHSVQETVLRMDPTQGRVVLTDDEVKFLLSSDDEALTFLWGADLPWATTIEKGLWVKHPNKQNDYRDIVAVIDGEQITIRETMKYTPEGRSDGRTREII